MALVNCGYKNCNCIEVITVKGVPLCEKHWEMYCEATTNDSQVLAFIRGQLQKNELGMYI